MFALQHHEAEVQVGMANRNCEFGSVRRDLNATRSTDDGTISSQKELTCFKLCWYRHVFDFATGLQRVATSGRTLSGLAGRATGNDLIVDDGKNALHGLGM